MMKQRPWFKTRLIILGTAMLAGMVWVASPAANAIGASKKPRTNVPAVMNLVGAGATPGSVITLATGSQKLTATADRAGNFAFTNLMYSASKPLLFNLGIPERAGPVNAPAANLSIRLKPTSSSIRVSGNIGKASSIALMQDGANSSKLYVAGENGVINFTSQSKQKMSGGKAGLKVNLISASEVCCPQMIVPATPLSFTISSAPGKAAPQTPYTRQPIAPSRPVAPPVVKDKPSSPSYNVPVSPPAEKQQPPATTPSGKPRIPYMVQGSVTTEKFRISTATGSYAISYDQAAYDDTYTGGMKKMTTDIRDAIMGYVTAHLPFFDGSNFLTARRSVDNQLIHTMKDYAPSEQICRFGTLSRSLATSDGAYKSAKLSIQQVLADKNNQRSGVLESDANTSLTVYMHEFQTKYCEISDNNNFLKDYCASGSDAFFNRDVDFTRVFDSPTTLYSEGTANVTALAALFRNLTYIPPTDENNKQSLDISIDSSKVQDRRTLSAIQSVANNTFASLLGQKTAGSEAVKPYMTAVLKQLGLSDKDIVKLTGETMSYNGQMEVLTKRLYQDPAFFANLYDSPQNVDRQRVAMMATKLMQDRDFLESLRRREMLLSTLLSMKLRAAGLDAGASGTVSSTDKQ